MRIALFVTCLADALFPRAAIATVELLERLGHDVVFPPGQTCCGQMHVNTGYLTEATALVRRHVEEFETAGCDAVVAPSGSCVGSVRHQHAMVARPAGHPASKRRDVVEAKVIRQNEDDIGGPVLRDIDLLRRALLPGDLPVRRDVLLCARSEVENDGRPVEIERCARCKHDNNHRKRDLPEHDCPP